MSNNLELAVKPVTDITPEDEKRVSAWINTPEYREKNFARQALVINPAHACQPLGAELAAHGFEGTLPFVHGSQGCASYYRSTLNRHFREPAPAVSDAMTEDGAVFGGQNNLHEGLENAVALYKPKMVAIFTSCMPEIIGDDLTAFIKNARGKGIVPEGMPVPFANTPSFNGTHIHGYDSMLLSILQNLTDFAGRPLTVLEKVYESEYTTAFGNRGIANLLYNWGRLYSDPEEALRVYTRECSVGVSAKDLGTGKEQAITITSSSALKK